MATINAIVDGNWSNPATWVQGTVPTAADDVYIGSKTITVDIPVAECANLYLVKQGDGTAWGGRLVISLPTTTITGNVSRVGATSNNGAGAVGYIDVMGTCTSLTINGDITAVYAAYWGIIRRTGSLDLSCTITVGGDVISPGTGDSRCATVFLLANSSTTAIDTVVVLGDVLVSYPALGGSSDGTFLVTCLNSVIDIHGRVYTGYNSSGGSGVFGLSTTGACAVRVRGNMDILLGVSTGYPRCWYDTQVTVNPSATVTHGLTVDGNISCGYTYSDAPVAYAIDMYRGTLTCNGTVSSVRVPVIRVFNNTQVYLHRVAGIPRLNGVVNVGGTYVGSFVTNIVDCRDSSTYLTTESLIKISSTVPRQFNVGTLYAGTGIGIVGETTAPQHTIVIDTLLTIDVASAPTTQSAPGVYIPSLAMKVLTKSLVIGNYGSWPIQGQWRVYDANSTVTALDNSDTTQVLSISGSTATMPDPADVRYGVAVNYTTGTYNPLASYTATIQALRNKLLTIKAKSDQLTFDGSLLNADVGDTSVLLTDVAAVKSTTDQFTFTAGGVVADGSSSQVAVDIQPVLDAVAGVQTDVTTVGATVATIKASTDQIMFDTIYQESDPYIADVVFKSEFESGNYTTESGQTATSLSGNSLPSISSTVSRTGTNSLAVINSTSMQYVDQPGFNFGAADFTIEFSVRFNTVITSNSDYAGIIGKRDSNSSFQWIVFVTNGYMSFLTSGTNTVSIVHTTPLAINTWYDVAISKSGANLRMFINDVEVTLPCPGMVLSSASTTLMIGRLSASIAGYNMNGYLDRVRLTKNVARYETSPPTYPAVDLYPTSDVGIPLTSRVVSIDSNYVSTPDYTPRFDALDTITSLVQTDVTAVKSTTSATGTATAAIKAKTDQLTFGINGVNATTTSADYTTRFNSIDAAISGIPTITYSSRFDAVDNDLANLVAGGGVDFTPVLTAITGTADQLTTVQSTASGIKAKTDQLTITQDGVVADVSVSINASINYDSRFDALDLSAATAATNIGGIKAKTDQLAFGTYGVNSTATVDTSGIATAVTTSVAAAINPGIDVIHTQLTLHDTDIKQQLTTVQNATGAISLDGVLANIATVNQNVLQIPTTTYGTRFNAVDGALVSIQGEVQSITDDIKVTKNLVIAGS